MVRGPRSRVLTDEEVKALKAEQYRNNEIQGKIQLNPLELQLDPALQTSLSEIKNSEFIRFVLDKFDNAVDDIAKEDNIRNKLKLAFRIALIKSYLRDGYDFENYVANNMSSLAQLLGGSEKLLAEDCQKKLAELRQIELSPSSLFSEGFEMGVYKNPYKKVKQVDDRGEEIDETPEAIRALSAKGKAELYHGITVGANKKPVETARWKLLQHLQLVLSKNSFPYDGKGAVCEKGKSIKLAELLGEKGVDLYKAALKEEMNDPRFRKALLNAASKVYKGKKLNQRIVARIIGPAAIGKTSGQDQAIAMLLSDPDSVDRLSPEDSENLFLSIDGALDREQSQMWGLMKQIALKKGFCEISDLYKNSKDMKGKNIMDAVARAEGFHKVIPDTCSSTAAKVGASPFKTVLEEDITPGTRPVLVHIVPTMGEGPDMGKLKKDQLDANLVGARERMGREKIIILRNGREKMIDSAERTRLVTNKNGKSRSAAKENEIRKEGLGKIQAGRTIKAEFKKYEGEEPLSSTKASLFATRFPGREALENTYDAGTESSKLAAEEFQRVWRHRADSIYFIAETDLSFLKIIYEGPGYLVECDPNEPGAIIAYARDIKIWNEEWQAYIKEGKVAILTKEGVPLPDTQNLDLRAWVAVHTDRSYKLTSGMKVTAVPIGPKFNKTKEMFLSKLKKAKSVDELRLPVLLAVQEIFIGDVNARNKLKNLFVERIKDIILNSTDEIPLLKSINLLSEMNADLNDYYEIFAATVKKLNQIKDNNDIKKQVQKDFSQIKKPSEIVETYKEYFDSLTSGRNPIPSYVTSNKKLLEASPMYVALMQLKANRDLIGTAARMMIQKMQSEWAELDMPVTEEYWHKRFPEFKDCILKTLEDKHEKLTNLLETMERGSSRGCQAFATNQKKVLENILYNLLNKVDEMDDEDNLKRVAITLDEEKIDAKIESLKSINKTMIGFRNAKEMISSMNKLVDDTPQAINSMGSLRKISNQLFELEKEFDIFLSRHKDAKIVDASVLEEYEKKVGSIKEQLNDHKNRYYPTLDIITPRTPVSSRLSRISSSSTVSPLPESLSSRRISTEPSSSPEHSLSRSEREPSTESGSLRRGSVERGSLRRGSLESGSLKRGSSAPPPDSSLTQRIPPPPPPRDPAIEQPDSTVRSRSSSSFSSAQKSPRHSRTTPPPPPPLPSELPEPLEPQTPETIRPQKPKK